MINGKTLFNQIESAKLDKDIETALKGLIARYLNSGDKVTDSRSDPYGYATRYYKDLINAIDDSNIDEILYSSKKYDTKLKMLVDYMCDTYGFIRESKKSARKSMKESVQEITDINIRGWDFDEAITFDTDVDSDNYGFVVEFYTTKSYMEFIIQCEDEYDGMYILLEEDASHGSIINCEMYDSYKKAKSVFIKNQM